MKSIGQSAARAGSATDQHAKVMPKKVHLKPGEQVLMDVKFSVIPSIFYYIASAVILIVVQRISTNMLVTALMGMLCMLTAFEAAKIVLYVQNSSAVITTHRIFGISGETKFNIDLKSVKTVKSGSYLLIDGGPLNYVKLRCLKNPMAVSQFMRDLTEK